MRSKLLFPRILITGGSGFWGSHIVQLAEQDDRWEPYATFYKSSPPQSGKTHWYQIDLRDRLAVDQLVRQICPSVIIHTAYGGPKDYDPMGITVAGSRNLAEAAADVSARLIHLSSDTIFDGENPPYHEENRTLAHNPLWPCKGSR